MLPDCLVNQLPALHGGAAQRCLLSPCGPIIRAA
jgi:hypothetical protein